MRVLLVSDPECDEAAASIRVGVGSTSDPPEIPGLAHFTEHMLFQGSKRFPGTHDFSDFIHDHGGYTNAFTSKFSTVFSFSIGPASLEAGLDRMADIFTAPLLKDENLNKEVNAVHSEYTVDLTDDAHRVYHIVRQTKKGGPFSNFTVGNLESLRERTKQQGINPVDAMREFHGKWYSSNLMTMAVVGRESLDELENIIRRHFSGVPNSGVSPPVFEECSATFQPLDPSELGSQTLAIPEADIHDVVFVFYMPPQSRNWRSKPLNYIAAMLNHQGSASLASKLKRDGLITSLSADYWSPELCTVFQVAVSLTEDGRSEESIYKIGRALFTFLRYLGLSRPERWRIEEIAKMRRLGFTFADMPDPYSLTVEAVDGLHYYTPREVLAGDHLIYRFEPDLIQQTLQQFLVPDNVRMFIFDKKLAAGADRVEHWFKIRHKVQPIAESVLKTWRTISRFPLNLARALMLMSRMAFPAPNRYLPNSVALVRRRPRKSKNGVQGTDSLPAALVFDGSHVCAEKCDVFHKQDNTFRSPKTVLELHIYYTESLPDAARERILTGLYVQSVNLALLERFYDARRGAISWRRPRSAKRGRGGGRSRRCIRGVAPTAAAEGGPAAEGSAESGNPLLAKRFFELALDNMRTGLRVAAFNRTPFRQANDAVLELIMDPYVPPHKMYAALIQMESDAGSPDALFEEVKAWANRFLKEAFIQGLVQGNISAQSAAQLVGDVVSLLPLQNVVAAENVKMPSIVPFCSLKTTVTPGSEPFPNEEPTRASHQTPPTPAARSVSSPSETEPRPRPAPTPPRIFVMPPLASENESTSSASLPAVDQRQETVMTPASSPVPTGASAARRMLSRRLALRAAAVPRLSPQSRLDSRGAEGGSNGLATALFRRALRKRWAALIRKAQAKTRPKGVPVFVLRRPSTAASRLAIERGPSFLQQRLDDHAPSLHRIFATGDAEEICPDGAACGVAMCSGSECERAGEKTSQSPCESGGCSTAPCDATGCRLAPKRTAEKPCTGDECSGSCQGSACSYQEASQSSSGTAVVATTAGCNPNELRPMHLFAKRQNMNPTDNKNQAYVVIEVGPLENVRDRALLYMVDRWMSQRFFNKLRTEQQLGYLTAMTALRVENTFYYGLFITTTYDPAQVAERIAQFLHEERSKTLTQEEFVRYQRAAIDVWKQKPKNIFQDFNKNIRQIILGDKIFDINERMVSELREVSREEVQTFRNRTLFKAPWLLMEVYSQREQPQKLPQVSNGLKTSSGSPWAELDGTLFSDVIAPASATA
ncbi:hypothetical protein BESB_052840 [Besnoitia besnoiti]|uniref:Rhoptry metalloprotease toxolysin TLN1 n=1 Tax=Besnoitia besnoiti TaxID=94643 RepID=A0A2A9MJ08_BESBE|nr:hypothetical protein BESB_052840 [Besnoitia besnoiti]PFH35633.1 hypothetical protein BESB_052840 [Besnoitia besnoiti]